MKRVLHHDDPKLCRSRAALLLLLLVACQDYEMASVGKQTAPVPIIDVQPSTLAFDPLLVQSSASLDFTISSTGDSALHVDEILLDAGGDFSLNKDPSATGLVLAKGESASLSVLFTPRAAGPRKSGLLVTSDDPVRPTVELALSGEGLAPGALIDPPSITLPTLPAYCTREETFTLRSVGSAALTVSDIAMTGTGASLLSPPSLPLVLEPEDELDIAVLCAPAGPGIGEAELLVESDDPARYTRATLSYDAIEAPRASDDFIIEDHDYLEILVYVDQSGSMLGDIEQVRLNARLFVEALASAGDEWMGWRLMVTLRDDGCHSGAIITQADTDPASLISDALATMEKGFWTEAGFTIATNALTAESIEGCNAGFIEPGGLLAMVLISDEPEQSSGTWSSYVEWFMGMYPGVVISAVAGPVPSGCSSAAPGVGYYEATMATGGTFLDFCSDWGENLILLGETIGSLDRTFLLSDEPQAETIQVWVAGLELLSGWTFDAGRNSVIFDPETSLPPGAAIHVEYDLVWIC